MQIRILVIVLLLVVPYLSIAQNFNWSNKSAKEVAVDDLFKRWNNPESSGCVVSVIHNGKVIYLQGYGEANLEQDIPNDPRKTKFNIASVSKQFTSFAILLLEREGKLLLDNDIRKYIPEVPDFGHEITLRHLATHTSGLRDQWNLLKLAGWRMDDVITNDHVFRLIKRQNTLNFKPGEEFRYSNTGHTLLAEVVGRVSGMTFGEFVKKRIFDPLGMNNSVFFDNHQMLVKNLADSYDGNLKDGFRKATMLISSVGATNLYSTAQDMTKWAMNFENPVVGDKEMIQKLNEVPDLNNGMKSEYALGQFPIHYKGLKVFEHSGAEAAFESYFIRFPEHNFSVTVLANSGSFWAEGLGRRVADIYLSEYLSEKADEVIQHPIAIKAIEVDPKTLLQYVGEYWSDNAGLQRGITLLNDTLRYVRSKTSSTKLIPIEKNRFTMEGVPSDTQVVFNKHNGGYTMSFIDSNETLNFIPMFSVKLSDYVGSYYSEELDTYYHLEIHNEKLIARHQRIDDIIMHPITANKFHSRTWFFKNIQFKRDESGEVRGFLISNRGVTNLVFKKVKGS